MNRATAFAPGTIGNVGPGFDVLGLAVDGVGDRVTVELTHGPARVREITGRDAQLLPTDVAKNVAAIAARAWLREAGIELQPIVSLDKGLPLAGGLGGSAASSVAGAFAAAAAAGLRASDESIFLAALEAESVVAGRHLDNIAPALLGGLTLVRSLDPMDVVSLPSPEGWWIALVTPHVRVATKEARACLPDLWDRHSWVQQMANTAALVHAFATADGILLRRALDDNYAEPRRAGLIPNFYQVKSAALQAGAFGCSISGSGPTIFAITEAASAADCGEVMRRALGAVQCGVHVAAIAKQGARLV